MTQPKRTRSIVTHAIALLIGIAIGLSVDHPDDGCGISAPREPDKSASTP